MSTFDPSSNNHHCPPFPHSGHLWLIVRSYTFPPLSYRAFLPAHPLPSRAPCAQNPESISPHGPFPPAFLRFRLAKHVVSHSAGNTLLSPGNSGHFPQFGYPQEKAIHGPGDPLHGEVWHAEREHRVEFPVTHHPRPAPSRIVSVSNGRFGAAFRWIFMHLRVRTPILPEWEQRREVPASPRSQ
jgi:hypothetical protein